MEDLSNEELAEPEVLNMEEAAAVRVDVSAFFDLCSAARAQFLAIAAGIFFLFIVAWVLGGEYKSDPIIDIKSQS